MADSDTYSSQPLSSSSWQQDDAVESDNEEYELFGGDGDASPLDDLDPGHVVERIHDIVTSLLLLLAEDHLPSLTFVRVEHLGL